MAIRRGYAARRIQRAFRKYRGRRAALAGRRMYGKIRRNVGLGNPQPTFVETFKSTDVLQVVAGSPGAGKTFKVRISDIPQSLQYFNLYKQYRINWFKVMLIPKLNTTAADPNTYTELGALPAGPLPAMGQARIVYAINDTPNVPDPGAEAEVLAENGCKISTIKTMWSCACKPKPDVSLSTAAGAPIWVRQKYREFFNFDPVLGGNNPQYGGISAWVTLPGIQPGGVQVPNDYFIYYKVSFTLRDPQ